MGTWQIVWIVLMCLSLGISLSKHGETKLERYNFWSSLLALAINAFVLYKGGFFG